MRILVAEDNVENQEIIRRRLERAGHSVTIAENGLAAVERAKLERPDLILMDISMPIMSGIEATQVIRHTPPIEQTPIIALTAHAMEGDADKCLAVGCDAFATKPVRFSALLDLIEEVFGKTGDEQSRAVRK
ncbi:MAG: response regulator [Parvularculaceae bacterium]|nr:response regulator [Parvularculaceae bacterium]